MKKQMREMIDQILDNYNQFKRLYSGPGVRKDAHFACLLPEGQFDEDKLFMELYKSFMFKGLEMFKVNMVMTATVEQELEIHFTLNEDAFHETNGDLMAELKNTLLIIEHYVSVINLDKRIRTIEIDPIRRVVDNEKRIKVSTWDEADRRIDEIRSAISMPTNKNSEIDVMITGSDRSTVKTSLNLAYPYRKRLRDILVDRREIISV